MARVRDRASASATTAQGLLATFCALGLCRFGYGLALPLWAVAEPAQERVAQLLVAVHLAGYLAWTVRPGFIGGRSRPDARACLLRLACCALALAATSLSTQPAWIGACRFAAGYAGAALLSASPVMSFQPISRAGPDAREAVVYMGGGLGLLLAGLATAALGTSLGASAYWLWLATACAVASALYILCFGWRAMHRTQGHGATRVDKAAGPVPTWLMGAIALFGCVLATPTMWWPYGLMLLEGTQITTVRVAAWMTAGVGVGAVTGPWLARYLMRVLACEKVAAVLLAGMAAGFLLPLALPSRAVAMVAALLCGLALTGATVALRQACEQHCKAPRAAWGTLTRISATAQVVSAAAAAAISPAALGAALFAASAVLAGAAAVVAATAGGGRR